MLYSKALLFAFLMSFGLLAMGAVVSPPIDDIAEENPSACQTVANALCTSGSKLTPVVSRQLNNRIFLLMMMQEFPGF